MDSTKRSVISALTRDHRQIERLLALLQAATDPEERRLLRRQVTVVIVQHAEAGDNELYGVLREAFPRGAIDSGKQIAAHVKVKLMLDELMVADAAGCEFKRLVDGLVAEMRQDIRTEEGNVFPWLVQWVDKNTLVDLGDEIQALRD